MVRPVRWCVPGWCGGGAGRCVPPSCPACLTRSAAHRGVLGFRNGAGSRTQTKDAGEVEAELVSIALRSGGLFLQHGYIWEEFVFENVSSQIPGSARDDGVFSGYKSTRM